LELHASRTGTSSSLKADARASTAETEFEVAQDDIAARMIEALDGASSLQLYQLKALIEGMLTDQRRMMASRANLHLGQTVRFVDFRTGQLRRGKVIAKHDTQATMREEGVSRTWKIPYVAIEPLEASPGDTAKPYDPPPEPAMPTHPSGFNQGDRVSFKDRAGNTQFGVIAKVNRRTATIETGDQKTWRVDFELLRHVVEV
jgi:hypothetical protein